MEVEFLSNMRYNLYVSEEEWKRWHVKLSRFSTYFNKASKTPLIGVSKPVPPVTPINPVFPYKLPSPPSPARYAAPTPIHQSCLPNPMNIARYSSQSPSRHYFEQDHNLGSRKRSLDYSADLPAAKRVMPTNSPAGPSPATLAAYAPGSNVSSNNFPDIPLNVSPIPKLPMPTVSSKPAPMPRQQPHLAPLSVPPARAMSIVYPNSQNNWSQPVTPVGTMPPSNMNLYANAIPTLGELTRSQYASANASPNAGGYGTLTPTRQLSPSYFLTHRNSPYRPVRSVNTLLIPPPSASLQHANRSIGHDQMRYQPLGKAPTEARAGVVPYIHHDAWPQPWNSTSAIPHINFHPPSRSLS